MRESVGSLRAYFLVAGVGATSNAVLRMTLHPGESALVLALGVGFLVAGIRLPALLAGRPAFLYGLLLGALGFQAVVVAAVLVSGDAASALILPVLYLAICSYLLVNVRRLAAEARAA